MKYLGDKSVSSFLSRFLFVGWYIVLILSIMAAIAWVLFVIFIPYDGALVSKVAAIFNLDLNNADWVDFKQNPVIVTSILIPYFGIFMFIVLKVIKNMQSLFTNFSKDIVFRKINAEIILKISKLLIVSSILTFNIYSLIVSLFLLILGEIFRSGIELQEEQDLTI